MYKALLPALSRALLRALILFFVINIPTFASVSVHYEASNTRILEIKNGTTSLSLNAESTTFDDQRRVMTFFKPQGSVFDVQHKAYRFQADQGVFYPEKQVLDLVGTVQVNNEEGAFFRAQHAMLAQDPFRLELAGGVKFTQSDRVPENLTASPAANPHTLTLSAQKATVNLKSKTAVFSGNCISNFTSEQPFEISSSVVEILDIRRQARFSGKARLQGHHLQADAKSIDVLFQADTPHLDAMKLQTFMLQGSPQLTFVTQDNTSVDMDGGSVTIDLTPDHALHLIEAHKNVNVKLPDGIGTSDNFIYTPSTHELIFRGHPARLALGQESFNGHEIRYHTDTKVIDVARADILYTDSQSTTDFNRERPGLNQELNQELNQLPNKKKDTHEHPSGKK